MESTATDRGNVVTRYLRMLTAAAVVPVVLGFCCAIPAHGATRPRVAFPSSVSPATAHSTRGPTLDPGRMISFAVTLKPRNIANLDNFLHAVTTPGSGRYHEFLTPAQFRGRYGPTPAAVRETTAFLRDQGLHVTGLSDNREVIDVTGRAGQIRRAFGTPIAGFTDPVRGRAFFSPTRAPTLPARVAAHVRGLVGLDDHAVVHHFSRVDHAAPAGEGLTPEQLRAAYDLAPLGDGSGATIAYWEFDGYDTASLHAYDQRFGLPPTTPRTVPVDGANYDKHPGDGQLEVELDLEIGHAVASKATQLVYEAPNTDQGQIDLAAAIASDAKADVVSISWGSCEPDTTRSSITGTADAIKQGTAEGISYVAAAGDDGSTDCARSSTGTATDAVDYPASDPNVTGVGGTTLHTHEDGSYAAEQAWSGSGGGESDIFDGPAWQPATTERRTVPDVAADADPATGYAIHTGGRWLQAGGTSAASPMWAGFCALDAASTGRLGNLNPALYRLAGNGLHDVTEGDNGTFHAGAGYDQVTGWGSFDAAKLARVLPTAAGG